MSSTSTVRYKNTVQPVYTDGRDIDLQVAELTGEAAQQKASGASEKHIKKEAQTWTQIPEPLAADPTYYDRPMLNASVWSWAIPAYYYVGGLAGGALVLGAAVQCKRSSRFRRLVKRCHWIGVIGCCISGALLVYDLGRPARFLNMLRVFRPTSPMSMGAWTLCATSGAAFTALVFQGRDTPLALLGEIAGFAAGVMGMALATYTGVLVSNTAVPIWQASRRMLPVLFAASAMTSVGSFFELLDQNAEEAHITKGFGTIGAVTEVTAAIITEQQASEVPRVGRPFKRGVTGFMWRSAAVLTASSVVIGMLPGKTRRKRLTSGVLGTLGSLLMRFAVEHAGNASARDPRAGFHRQRAETFAQRVASP
ncbi:MAG TPA: NrfD/PsrC family molybdoenzyme membrane anchor subunit [Bryobacteraceae bacterium]|nr:NrfD/PsrC family molybdoenzyme membrane anchor subunit [Bryobacteraceae bacterium]